MTQPGLCACGCGQPTTYITKSDPRNAAIKGCFRRFISGHNIIKRALAERFWPKVRKTDTCWEWIAGLSPAGYGVIGSGGKFGKPQPAHRVSWQIAYGEIPGGMWILHKCDNPRCVRPDHLFLGTAADNTADMISKGRQRFGMPSRGERNAAAKLTRNQVAEIRSLIAGSTQGELARQFNVSQATVSDVIRGKKWKD